VASHATDPDDDVRDVSSVSGRSVRSGGGGERLWLPLNALRAFEAVAKRLSFTGAAASLNTSQSALSRHVSRLEELLGRRLLERRPQGLVLTAAGAALLPVVAKSFDRIEAALDGLRRDAASGPRVLRVHMPPTFLQIHGLTLLREFRAAFPDILIDVSSSNGFGLPAGRGLDVSVVFDRPQVDDTVRDLLWMVDQIPACAPALAERCAGMTLTEFLRANELLHTKLEGEPLGILWSAYARHHNIDIAADRGLAFDTEVLAVQSAIAGGGVVLVDPEMFAAEVADGRLVTPFGPPRASGFGYYLTLHPDDMADPAISVFRTWVIQRFGRAMASGIGAKSA
jgi:DNA-binding transcriptional LysR family regulator